jgi:hypothetical protein
MISTFDLYLRDRHTRILGTWTCSFVYHGGGREVRSRLASCAVDADSAHQSPSSGLSNLIVVPVSGISTAIMLSGTDLGRHNLPPCVMSPPNLTLSRIQVPREGGAYARYTRTLRSRTPEERPTEVQLQRCAYSSNCRPWTCCKHASLTLSISVAFVASQTLHISRYFTVLSAPVRELQTLTFRSI